VADDEALLTQIMTITPSPAIDVSTSVGQIAPFSKLRCAAPRRDPGGGGINVARVIKRLGGDITAIYPAGGATGQLLRTLMDREDVSSVMVTTLEETREDFTILETTTGKQFRFVMPGARLAEEEWQRCLDLMTSIAPQPTFIIASGSLPPGVPDDFFARAARMAREVNARFVVDTSGSPLVEALREGVYLIKPNLREFQELTDVRSAEIDTLAAAGRDLIRRGLVTMIALSLGPDGALLIARDDVLRAEALPVKPVSVVGAGDSFLGAMVWSLARSSDLDLALRYGVAAGSAAVLNAGTKLCKKADVERLVSSVTVHRVPLARA
jgi:6-phosphofructokinase 2